MQRCRYSARSQHCGCPPCRLAACISRGHLADLWHLATRPAPPRPTPVASPKSATLPQDLSAAACVLPPLFKTRKRQDFQPLFAPFQRAAPCPLLLCPPIVLPLRSCCLPSWNSLPRHQMHAILLTPFLCNGYAFSSIHRATPVLFTHACAPPAVPALVGFLHAFPTQLLPACLLFFCLFLHLLWCPSSASQCCTRVLIAAPLPPSPRVLFPQLPLSAHTSASP